MTQSSDPNRDLNARVDRLENDNSDLKLAVSAMIEAVNKNSTDIAILIESTRRLQVESQQHAERFEIILADMREDRKRADEDRKRADEDRKRTAEQFEANRKLADERFEAERRKSDERFEAERRKSDERFEAERQHSDQRFEQLLQEIQRRGGDR